MNKEKAYSIIEVLANGVDPITGECFPDDSPYNHPDVIRALFFALRNQPMPKKVKKTLVEKQQENIAGGLPKNYGLPWTDDCVEQVIEQFKSNTPIDTIADNVARKPSSIIGVLKKKEIITEEQAFSMGLHYRR